MTTSYDLYDLSTDFHNAMVGEAQEKINWFSDLHPHLIPDPNPPMNAPDWANYQVRAPHTLWRDGDWMGCTECEVHIFAPSAGRYIETNPMVNSLSRFD